LHGHLRTAGPGTLQTAMWLGCYLLATALLLWPLLLNADYLYFHDTAAYLRYPAEAFRRLLGVESALSVSLSAAAAGAPEAAGAPAAAGAPPAAGGAEDTVAAGRSIYYGAMLYAGALLGGLWIGILVQLGCVALALHMTLDALLGPERRRLFPPVVAALAVLTPLPFFVCYLMPDVFAGIAILAVANLFALDPGPGPGRRLLWFGLLAMALLFHTSHVAVALLMLAPAAALAWFLLGRSPWRAASTVALAIGAGVLGELLFAQVVEAVYGAPPLRPPFLMARLLSGEPGHAYLAATCPENGFRICAWLPRLPADSDLFLWSADPERGIYGIADAATRRALAAEQMALVTGVLRFDPLGQLAVSLGAFAEQLGRFGLQEFAYDDSMRSKLADMLPTAERMAFVGSALYRGAFPLGLADALIRLAVAAAAAYLVWTAVVVRRPPPGSAPDAALPTFAVILIGGVVANAAVTGILSTPHDRYQARVIWLIPLLAMIVLLRRRRRPPAATP
jgi:hypothetical protein